MEGGELYALLSYADNSCFSHLHIYSFYSANIHSSKRRKLMTPLYLINIVLSIVLGMTFSNTPRPNIYILLFRGFLPGHLSIFQSKLPLFSLFLSQKLKTNVACAYFGNIDIFSTLLNIC